jgi:vancomycin permeability regulator SanA
MDTGISLYKSGKTEKLLLSGDRSDGYDEVSAMKAYAMSNGVDEEDIITDGYGYSTYESITRAVYVYGASDFIVVTQKYHLYRALYIAKDLGIDSVGVSADLHRYGGQLLRDVREILARDKDFMLCLLN